MKLNLQKVIQSLMEVGVTQRQIAKEAHCSQPMVSHIYHGVWGLQRANYTLVTNLLKVAKKHGIREDGSKVAAVHKRGSWTPMPPVPSKNKIVKERKEKREEKTCEPV